LKNNFEFKSNSLKQWSQRDSTEEPPELRPSEYLTRKTERLTTYIAVARIKI
jgi:hypothetical protein